MNDSAKSGIVFNTQKFSVHDGVGIRTLIFLKGCPLRCRWCSNPESQRPEPQHAFNPMRCITAEVCGRCAKACPSKALTVVDGLICNNPALCRDCFACAEACPSGSQSVYGERMTVGQVLAKVEEDDAFYRRSGGGVTLSGGEPLMQPEFAIALLKEARRRHINTTIESCGFYDYKHLREAASHLNKLIFDIKCFDGDLHKRHTGVDNARILANFRQLCEDFPDLPIRARTPVIPGFNDSEAEIAAIRDFVPRKPNIEYELLAYHRMGQPKYAYIGRKYELEGASLDEGLFERLKEIAK